MRQPRLLLDAVNKRANHNAKQVRSCKKKKKKLENSSRKIDNLFFALALDSMKVERDFGINHRAHFTPNKLSNSWQTLISVNHLSHSNGCCKSWSGTETLFAWKWHLSLIGNVYLDPCLLSESSQVFSLLDV